MNEDIVMFLLSLAALLCAAMIAAYWFDIRYDTGQPKPRKLSATEAEWLADYFHNDWDAPDYDGYVGYYVLPERVMKIYRKKYGKKLRW